MRIESNEQVYKSIPVLKKIVKMTKDNPYMEDVYREAERALKNAERCERFGICSRGNDLGYGCGIYVMHHICNVETYDETQPEELLTISFPTGAFIFGDRYDTEYFKEFYSELLEVEPDYHDTINHALYYKPEKAKKAWEHYREIYQKYMRNNGERIKEWKLEQAKRKYEELLSLKEGKQKGSGKDNVDKVIQPGL